MAVTHIEEVGEQARRADSGIIRVLIVDDHPLVCHGYELLLQQRPRLKICGTASGATEALQLAHECQPHLALVDLSLKEGSGLELIKVLSRQYPDIKILTVSTHDDRLFAQRVLTAGSRGFVNKQTASDHLLRAIDCVLDGEISLNDEMTKRISSAPTARGTSQDMSPVEKLSNRELEAFELIGSGLTTREIAERMSVSPKTVERYRENIKHKLSLSNAVELVRCSTQWVLEKR